SLTVKMENWRNEPAKVALLLTGAGLDQRVATVDAGTFDLGAGETREVQVPLERLPIQSVGAPAQIDLSGVCTTNGSRRIQLPTTALHVQFEPGYGRAYASTEGGWDVMALGLAGGDTTREAYQQMKADEVSTEAGTALSIRTSKGVIDKDKARSLYDKLIAPAAHPTGRYMDDEGKLTPLTNPRAAGVPITLRSDQMAALTEIMDHGAPEDPKTEDSASTSMETMDLIFVRYVTMCARWGVQYNDSGLGEDYLNGSGYQTYPARYATGQIRKVGGSDYWIGHLDSNGCAPNTFLPYGDYSLRVRPDFDTTNNTRFYETAGSPSSWHEWWMSFSVVSGVMLTTLTTPNHGASRVGAVVSQLLVTSDTGIGLTANHEYQLAVKTDDCGGSGAYSSGDYICYGNDPYGGPHTTVSKVTIAHEIGHSVDAAGSGHA
ncbi:MAG: hypothetical protein ACOC1F_09450, partial [Myxococcota bacterium]